MRLSQVVQDLEIVDEHAYLLEDNGVLRVLDIGVPTRPRELGKLAAPKPGPEAMDVVGHHVYIAHDDGCGSSILLTRRRRAR